MTTSGRKKSVAKRRCGDKHVMRGCPRHARGVAGISYVITASTFASQLQLRTFINNTPTQDHDTCGERKWG